MALGSISCRSLKGNRHLESTPERIANTLYAVSILLARASWAQGKWTVDFRSGFHGIVSQVELWLKEQSTTAKSAASPAEAALPL